MEEILARLLAFQIVIDLISVTVGAGLCFGALKWRRGLLTTTAIAWGLFLGVIAAMFIGEAFGEVGAILCVLVGLIGLPILTYVSPTVNRFVLGFLVSSKLLFMLTTVLAKEGAIGIEETIMIPLAVGTVVGIALMAWTQMRVSAFVLGCTFIGASQIAPVVSEWINRIFFAATGDIGYLFDPIDLFFALFKIELCRKSGCLSTSTGFNKGPLFHNMRLPGGVMAESVFEPGLDMEEYLAKRALEIPDLGERKLFKDVVEKLLIELYHYTQGEYAALETRVFGELQSVQSDYAIYIGMIDRAHYDATDPFLHPILPSDTEKRVHSVEELQKCLRANQAYPLYSVFLETDYQTIQEFSVPGHIYHGTVFTEHGQYRAKCTVQPDTAYRKQIEHLYHIFTANYLPWSTVCAAYLHKFFQVNLIAVEDIDPKETIQEIRVDFEGYASHVRYDCFPLWNLAPVSEKTSTYPEPCMDRTNYDHRIFAHRLMEDRQYLVANTDVEITNVRRLEGDLFITCPEENPYQWMLYRVDRPSKQSHTSYPVLSNLSRESFAGNLSDRYRRGIKTKAEISRILAAYSYEDYVVFQNVALEASADARCQTYPMDDFILDELRTEKAGMTMTLTFSSKRPEHFLTLDIMSFLVSQVQSLFPEYVCQGKLV